MSGIRVVVIDDHPFYREGVKSMVPLIDAGIEVVGEAGDGAEGMAVVARLEPDVVLMDLSMPGMGGLDATRALRASHPDIAILVLTMMKDDSVIAALEAGAGGYLLKDATVEDVCRAIRSVHRGELVVDGPLAARLLGRIRASNAFEASFPQLTARERDILTLLAEGVGNADIARRLFLTPKTVRNYVSTLVAKLGVDDREHAAALGRAAR
ncbi:DNA-binding NarL/FixJ family response regulator [Microbacterium terrae]|uniref:Transcriptional regulatory protein LiaR n=1 Tax=Microbacterium terrae TaxID=69369 RepID=A0A0M2H4F4_9MICO|nr:response regulator transcription factor [Microbacterium terrae]KJL38736.1 Transcriptional regulatory protein LiaR [Microbacterium terrae]MBP1076155.1 DNA-binding NarL/FixJ family response regulator [Microbacterium terrae]GLJ96975.1 DNA-binding response regulator [Microbacterium terrae]